MGDWTRRVRLRHLEIVLALAESGNISQTAAALNMTQPGISRWLKELEDDIGLPLFERHARGLKPTSHGDALIAHARQLLNYIDLTRDDLDARKHNGSGIVRLGCSGATTTNTAPSAVAALTAELPQCRISVTEGTMDTLLEQLAQGRLDIVIGRSARRLLPEGIRHETIYMEPLHFISGPGHPLARAGRLEWAQLYRYRWLVWPPGTPIRQELETVLLQAQKSLPEDHIESNSANFNLNLLAQTDFISVASSRTARRWQHFGLIAVLDLPLPVLGSVSAFWREDSIKRTAVKRALESVRAAGWQTDGG
ncbi:LysR family transcriptional regulator [Bergeriella denitrificans]|uniref:Transcriptional activator MetR n=1 Tax=Bergeriella denitrificans TaxID=494 RepID=A0A378UID1_BERDE|nr:LysR substrate-binding domain-containing protein [Bergeriella denitrificans]STZ77144.1 transcriptional activator MetR [Bergeriella denitrificans]